MLAERPPPPLPRPRRLSSFHDKHASLKKTKNECFKMNRFVCSRKTADESHFLFLPARGSDASFPLGLVSASAPRRLYVITLPGDQTEASLSLSLFLKRLSSFSEAGVTRRYLLDLQPASARRLHQRLSCFCSPPFFSPSFVFASVSSLTWRS